MTEEEYLRFQLEELHKSYQKAAQQIIERLSRINALKDPVDVVITSEQWQVLQALQRREVKE